MIRVLFLVVGLALLLGCETPGAGPEYGEQISELTNLVWGPVLEKGRGTREVIDGYWEVLRPADVQSREWTTVGFVEERSMHYDSKGIVIHTYEVLDLDLHVRGVIDADDMRVYPTEVYAEPYPIPPGVNTLQKAVKDMLGIKGKLSVLPRTPDYFRKKARRAAAGYETFVVEDGRRKSVHVPGANELYREWINRPASPEPVRLD